MELNSKQIEEIKFWAQLASDPKRYAQIRRDDLEDNTRFFPRISRQRGVGLDVGCGPTSMWEYGDKEVVACDPLMDEYKKIAGCERGTCSYFKNSDDLLPFADRSFDWAWCINVIDHTPKPEKLIEEIERVMKLGALLYFEVNFDSELSPAHYGLWNERTVAAHTGSLLLLDEAYNERPQYKQTRYYATFRKQP